MILTLRVIQETMRVASVLSFTFREAVQDVEYEGYRIPKGWKVLPLFWNIHHSEEYFDNPDKFDPSRFDVRINLLICLLQPFFVALTLLSKPSLCYFRLLRSPTPSCRSVGGPTPAPEMS